MNNICLLFFTKELLCTICIFKLFKLFLSLDICEEKDGEGDDKSEYEVGNDRAVDRGEDVASGPLAVELITTAVVHDSNSPNLE